MKSVFTSPQTRSMIVTFHVELALVPLLWLLGLGGMTARAVQLLGSFPRHPPTYYQLHHSDRLYEGLLWFSNTLFVITLLTWIPWFCLTAFSLWWQWRYWSRVGGGRTALGWGLPAAVYVLCHLILYVVPPGDGGWYLK